MINRYSNIEVIRNNTGKRYYTNNIYPDIAPSETDIYIISTIGDRLDLIAYDYYNDVSLYWIIASANSLPSDSLVPPLGMQLRIPSPTEIENLINEYINVNENR